MVGIDEACSGIRSFQAAVMVALFLGELFRYKFFRRIFFLLSGVALAFGCNVVRTTYLVRVCDLKGISAVNMAHDPAGFAILGITLAGLLVLAWFFRPRKRAEAGGGAPSPALEMQSAAELEVRTRWSEAGIQASEQMTAGSSNWPTSAEGSRLVGVKLTGALVGVVLWILAVEVGIEGWFRPTEVAPAASNWSLRLPTQRPEFREPPIRDSVRSLLKYDEGRQAEWREANGRPWQVYYLHWYPARTRYRASEAVVQARGHAPDVCLQLAGMTLQKDFGSQLRHINGIALLTKVEKFSDQGRPLHVLSCYWEPNPATLQDRPSGPPSTANALRNALHALRIHDRGHNEKYVLRIGVWGMETDEEAETAFRELLERAITKAEG